MNCLFQKEDDKLVCIQCGFSLPYRKYNNGIQRNCTKPTKINPKINNLVKEVKKQAKAIVNFEETKPILSSKEEVKDRLSICNACEHYSDNKCSLCGCFLSFKIKLENSNCPIGKW